MCIFFSAEPSNVLNEASSVVYEAYNVSLRSVQDQLCLSYQKIPLNCLMWLLLYYIEMQKRNAHGGYTHLKITSANPMFLCVQIKTQIEDGAVLS
jgi:hypothetical protein